MTKDGFARLLSTDKGRAPKTGRGFCMLVCWQKVMRVLNVKLP
jgi:hypothetical protein